MEAGISNGARRPKVLRSYRLVFRRRWRLFRIQNWRIPLPGGLELRALGYWLGCVVAMAVATRLPVLGLLLGALPASLRFGVLPLGGAWALSSLEIDGRSPHRALAALIAWRLRARSLAALRRCPGAGEFGFAEPRITIAADLRAATYPRGRLHGPARVLLRYPVAVKAEGGRGRGRSREEQIATARRWRLRATGAGPLGRGRVLEVPAGREVIFE
jgi:hypothetical protein